MADNTNYIGVAMGLDVTDLKAGLSEANKQIQLANSEFKAASSGMDDWTKSIEGVSAKVKQLDTVLASQKSKLAGLTAEYEKVAKEQGEGSEAARRLKVQINNQQAVVNKTQQEFNNYSETLNKAEQGIIDLEKASIRGGKAVQNMGDNAKKAGDGFTVMKGVMADLVSSGIKSIISGIGNVAKSIFSLADSTQEYREDISRLDAAFEASGKTAESAKNTYTDLYRAIGETDTAVEASQQIALLAKSEEEAAKWAGLATGVVGTFGDALKPETFFEAANETIKLGEATGAFTQMLEGTGYSVDKFNAELAACTTEQEKQALMLRISEEQLGAAGKAYEESAGSILDAREASANLTEALANLGAIAEPIMTTLKQLAADLLTEMQPFVELIGEGLTTAFAGGAGGAQMLADGIGGILDMLVERVTEMLPTVLNLILGLVPQIANTLLSALPQLVTVVIDLVTQIINMLGTLLPQIVVKITEILPQIINALIEAIPQLLQAAITLLMAIVQAIPTIIDNLISALPSIITTIIDAVIQAFPLLLDGAIQLLMAIIEAIPTIVNMLVKNLPKIINAIIDGVLGALPILLDAAVTLLMAIIDAIPLILPPLISALPKIITSIVKTLTANIDKIIDGAIQLLMGIIDAIPQIIPPLIKAIPDIISSIVDGLIKGIPDLIDAGADLLAGLFEGFLDPTAIWNNVKKLGGSIVDAAKSFFGIKSPSKLMRDEIGEYLGEGVGVGMLDSLPTVKKNLTKFGNYITDNLGGIKSGLSLGVTGAGAGAYAGAGNGGRVVNIDARQTLNYNGNMSLKEVKQREREHLTTVKMKMKAEGWA